MRWFVAIVLCCAAQRVRAQQPVRVDTLNNTKIDKVGIVHEQLWAAGGGSVFIYKNSKWSPAFRNNGEGEAYAMGAITTSSHDTTTTRNKDATNLGIVCFARDRGLCSVYDPESNRAFSLDDNQARDFAAPGTLLTLLQDHARGTPLLIAVNQNATPVNEVPLQLAELSSEEFQAKMKSDAVKLSLKPYTVDNRGRNDSFAIRFRGWKSYFPPIHYLYSFQHHGFVYIVTVQPAIDSQTFRYETRIARFCLQDDSMTTYAEVPVRCKTPSYVFEVAVHARMVHHMNQFLLFMSMGSTEQGARYSRDKSAICVFNIEDLDEKFRSTIDSCNFGGAEAGVRKIKYYQEFRGSGPLRCEQTDRRQDFCSSNKRNKYIISMTEFEGDVVYANSKKAPLDVTYIYNATRILSAPVGVLTAFEIEPPETPTSTDPLFIWAVDHRGQIHRILYITKSTESTHSESMLLITVPRPIAKNGYEVESVHYENRTMFVIDKSVVEIYAADQCSLFLNCGDCLNPRAITRSHVSCIWENDRCVHSEDLSKLDSAFCRPAVMEKSPFSGPQRGGTRFKIRGFDLGDSASVRVMFGDQRCRIISWDNMTGICEVPPDRDSKTKVDITLNVKDHKHDARMKTYPIATDGAEKLGTFTYYSVEFFGVHPSFGPRKGATHLRISGQNIGRSGQSAQYGLFGSGDQLICKDFVVRSGSELSCNTTEYFGPEKGRGESFNLVLKIDGVSYEAVERPEYSQVFVYEPNPANIKLSPLTKTNFYAKGSRSYPIMFVGENLDSGAFPTILVTPLGHQNQLEAPCLSNVTDMSCNVPPLSEKLVLEQPLPATVTLRIDGFAFNPPSFRITYYPNATIILNDGEKFVIDSDGPKKISIRGKNLLPLNREEVEILVDDQLCEIGTIEDNMIECHSESLRAGDYSIQVDVAGRKYSAFMSTIVTAGNGLGAAAVAAIVVSCLIVLIALTFLALRYVPLREKFVENEPVVQYTPENDGYLRPDNDRNTASDNERLLPTIPPDPDIINLLSEEGLLMDFSCIQVGSLIGRGQFGCVYRGILKRDKLSEEEPVAVKTLQQRGLTSNDANVFLKEALRMKDFNHQNVLRLIGVSFDNNNSTDPMIIVPFMANGDLLTYIRNQDNKPTVKDLITFGANIALGMSYLTTQKFVHRDLAARNCMLGEDLIVRVADFGLSRDVYETSYYSCDNTKTKLPVKWMAIESLKEGVYSHKSDVWSYGVVLWELMTRGCVPLPNVDNWEVQNWLISGRRMLKPSFCPDALYEIMLACWDEDPKKRPTFSQLVKDVPNVIHTIETASRNQIPSYVNL
ncbi:hepatocyte growth factor receptor [Galendromus occidentalis]|uniref:receptor protein-tyrosine kinase n=1 Tax=Galendromus occidentalis TaxID=34638 RepID=A0AAJ6QNE4_9ACAR|nr:hepatocyte growth factor receptor [Galendromus occidentalis]